jgi:glycosyltransferase involved in cell wall biosynthesis
MHVLILHQHFKTPQTGGAIRSYYLAKALVDAGMKVTVLSAHNEKEVTANIEGIEVHYLSVPYDNAFGFLKRIVSFFQFIVGVLKNQKLAKEASVCYAISTPLTIGIPALYFKWQFKLPYLFEVGDLWPEAPIQLGFIKSPLLKFFLYRLEKIIYLKSVGLVALSVAIENELKKKAPGKPVYLIPNMADTDFYHPQLSNTDEAKINIAYIGAMGFANGLDYLLECARACARANLPVRFTLCGEGAMLSELKRYANQLSISNLHFVPFQNREGVKKLMDQSQAAFICYRDVPVLETGSPNKYFDALAGGKLIISNFGGWIKNEIEKTKCGFALHPQKPFELPERIKAFLLDRTLLRQYQEQARKLAEEKYSRKIVSERFVQVIKNAMSFS